MVLLALGLLLTAPAPAQAEGGCAPLNNTVVRERFEVWNQALQSGDPEQVADLYSADALLLPTLSSQPRRSHAAIADYFRDFLARGPQGRIDSRSIELGCNQALDAGTYSFRLADGSRVAARYTFVYVFRDGQWQIRHHHSSLQPAG